MIIPIRCFTCNKVISDKWIPFIEKVNEKKSNDKTTDIKDLDIEYIDLKNPKKSIECKVLDEMGIHKYCCRRMMISNVHMISYIS